MPTHNTEDPPHPEVPSAVDLAPSESRTRRIVKLLTDFVLGQGAVQGIGVLVGLFLVRTLSVSDYAQFGLASGFQFTTSVLMDLGYASTIIPLVGERVADRRLVGHYVREAKAHRDRAYWVLAPLASVAFLYITHRQHWEWPIQIILLLSILIALYASGPASYFGAPLVLYRRLRAYYIPQSISGIARLLASIALWLVGQLNAWTSAVLYAFNLAANGFLLKRSAMQFIEWPEKDDLAIRKEIWDYILPATPAILLGAFHGQIALFLVGIFGNTVGVAQVAALSRLAQVFSGLMTFNVVVVEPYVARRPARELPATYFKLLALAAAGCAFLTFISFLAPGIFLWPLGPKYAPLRNMMGLVILTISINYIAGLIWIMNRARKWIFWRGTIAQIVLVAVVELGYLIVFGVRNTHDAVIFNLAGSLCFLVAHSYITIYGFRRGPGDPGLDNIPNQAAIP